MNPPADMNSRSIYRRLLTASLAAMALLTMVSAGVQAQESEDGSAAMTASSSSVADLETAYKQHSDRRNEIARKLNLLWFEERELKAEYEDDGRTGNLPDFYELAAELRAVREKIDAARNELSQENKIIVALGNQIPD